MTQSIQFVSGQTLRAAAGRSLASPRLLLCPLSTLVTGLDAMQRDYNFSLRGDWRRGTLQAAACRAEAEGETEGLTMGSDGTKGDPADVPTTSDTQENYGLAPATPAKETKTAEELAMMIRQDLSKVDGCPRHGVTVTVYGLNPWNSLVTFGVDAGPIPNKADLLDFCDIITERLKRLYDVRG